MHELHACANVVARTVNISIGTIFGILRRRNRSGPVSKADLLQPGRNLVAAGYVLYGSATCLVYSTGNGVNEFTLDPSSGEFVLTRAGIKIKPRHGIYSVNEGNASLWHEATRRYVDNLKHPPPGSSRKPYSLRYVGSMVADVHRTLIVRFLDLFLLPLSLWASRLTRGARSTGGFSCTQRTGRAAMASCACSTRRIRWHF
jgi:fructose-1,6-bisphosphatase I